MTVLTMLLCFLAGSVTGYGVARWRSMVRDSRVMYLGFLAALGGGRE